MLDWSRPFRWLPAAAVALAVALPSGAATAQEGWPETPPAEPPAHWGPVSIDFSEIPYPYPVQYVELRRQGQDLRMAYMDVPARGTPNGQTVVIQHGMNFYSEAYTPTINALADAGFRVIAVDRIGYGKSSKPIMVYNFGMVAADMKAVLDELGIEKAAIVGHSMGGMVVSRFAMLYPEVVTHVAMVNQIGLTDQRQGRPWSDPFAAESYDRPTYQSMLRGHTRYYPNRWPPEHLEYVRRQYGQTLTGEWPRLAMVRRLQSQMMYEDPVVYDWQHIQAKTLVIGGEEDGLIADFPAAVRHVVSELPNGTLVLYPGIGHNPQTEIPDQFHGDLIRFLRSDPAQPASEWR